MMKKLIALLFILPTICFGQLTTFTTENFLDPDEIAPGAIFDLSTNVAVLLPPTTVIDGISVTNTFAENVYVFGTPTNYNASATNAQAHFEGIDEALGSVSNAFDNLVLNAVNIGVGFTPTNYSVAATNVEAHLIGIDQALPLPTVRTNVLFTPGTTYNNNNANYRSRRLNDNSNYRWSFKVPDDADSILSVDFVGWPDGNEVDGEFEIRSSYGAIGEAIDTHEETVVFEIDLTDDEFVRIPATNALSVIAGGDLVGLRLYNRANENMRIIGIEVVWTENL